MSPKVSVVIPAYNCEQYIDEAVQSVLQQTFSDYELILIDNCSTDNTYKAIEKYKDLPQVSIFKNEKNLGMGGNWNQCIRMSNGEYLKFLCADDFFAEKDMLADYVKVFDKYPDVSLVFSPKKILRSNGSIDLPRPYFTGKKQGADVIDDIIQNHLNPLGEPSSIMFRKKHLYVGLFNGEYSWVTDIDYWLRLCAEGDVYGLEKHYAVFRVNDQQGTQQLRNSGRFLHEEKNFIYYNFYIRNSGVQYNKKLYRRAQHRQLFNNIRWGTINYRQALSYLDVFPWWQNIFLATYISAFYTGRFFKRRLKKNK